MVRDAGDRRCGGNPGQRFVTASPPDQSARTRTQSNSTYGIIGFGPISRRIAQRLTRSPDAPKLVAFLVRERSQREAIAQFGEEIVCLTLDEFMARKPVIAIEGASAKTLAAYGEPLLGAGIDVMPLSLGAFADPATEVALLEAARRGPGRLEIPAGALGSIGFIAAGRDAGLHQVVLRISYPVKRWQSMGAFHLQDLGGISEPTLFMSGSVREIAARFPGHLNVSVAAALAGLGLDKTQVELIADPVITQASFRVTTSCEAGPVTLHVGGRDAPEDDDPVDYTTFSIMRLLRRRDATIAI